VSLEIPATTNLKASNSRAMSKTMSMGAFPSWCYVSVLARLRVEAGQCLRGGAQRQTCKAADLTGEREVYRCALCLGFGRRQTFIGGTAREAYKVIGIAYVLA